MIRINGDDMKELAMFYNFSDERLRKAKFALMPLKIQVKKVEKEEEVAELSRMVEVQREKQKKDDEIYAGLKMRC